MSGELPTRCRDAADRYVCSVTLWPWLTNQRADARESSFTPYSRLASQPGGQKLPAQRGATTRVGCPPQPSGA
jgi:hypothetical protein